MEKLIKSGILFFAFVFLAGCATGYHPYNIFAAGGYKDSSIAPNIYQVEYKGNELTSKQTAYNYAMRRSAEITINQGYEYFEVLDNKTTMVDDSFDTMYGRRTVIVPQSVLQIKPVKSKSLRAYEAQKVLTQTVPR